MTALPQPMGQIVRSLPFEQYLDLPEESATSLKDMLTSPLLYWRRRQMPRQDTDTLRQGRAGHTAILEPDRFMLEYALWPKKNGRRFGAKWDDFRAAHEAQTILTEEQYKTALKMRDAARAHPVAKRYLEERGQVELSIKWVHPRTGIRLKSRLDWLCSALVDIKTTRNPAPGRFSSDAAKFGYALQLALYGDAVTVATGEALPTKLLAIQSMEPFDVVVFDVPEDVLQVGRQQYEDALDKVIECRKSGIWPGLAHDEEVTLHLPAWAVPEDEEPIVFGDQAI